MANGDEKQKQIQLQALPEVKPFFADGILVGSAFHEYGKTKERDATINMTFVNQNIVVSNIRVTIEHAKALVEILKEEIEKAENFKRTGERPKQEIAETRRELSYIG